MADDLPRGEEKAKAVRAMFDAISERYDLVNRIMTLRLDLRWRRRCVSELRLQPGSLVADLACGTGDLCRDIARGGLRPIGFDFSLGMLGHARTDAPLTQADALRLPLPDRSVDGITCGFALRNFTDLDRFLTESARVVRAGGRIALLEVAEPRLAVLRWGHSLYFGKVVPRIGALLSDASAYRYLPRSVAYLPATADLVAMVRTAGFTDVRHRLLSGGISQLITATRA
ncbi:MAG TPA: ubiquinone/menaquinone biosynthesis methyltransferase [Acidimicrobiales bacterium]